MKNKDTDNTSFDQKSFEELNQILHELDHDKQPDKYNALKEIIEKRLSQDDSNSPSIFSKNEITYGGFWRRFSASILDGIIQFVYFAIVYILLMNLPFDSKLIFKHIASIFAVVFDLFLLTKYGGSIGKIILGLKVIKSNGQNISILNASLRSSINILSVIVSTVLLLVLFNKIDFDYIRTINGEDLNLYWKNIYPSWSYILNWVLGFYSLSESFVMLTNKRRRAIHDFIGGTIVICRPKTLKEVRFKLYESIPTKTNTETFEID